jgi:hypothetical protein
VLNPLLKLTRVIKPLAMGEILAVFVMCLIASGVPTYGFASHVVPIVAGYSNPHFNSDQSKWDIYVEPFLKDRLFIAAEGTQEGAQRLRDATLELGATRDVYNAARDLRNSRRQLAAAEERLRAHEAAGEAATASRHLLERQARLARASLAHAGDSWQEYATTHDLDEVLKTYGKKIRELRKEVETRRTALKKLKGDALAEITVFRRGLPKEMRAIPGIVYVPGEGLTGYAARLRRLRVGRRALARLRDADLLLEEARASAGALPAEFWQHLREAHATLEPIADIPSLSARKGEIEEKIEELRQQEVDDGRRLERLRHERRFAPASEFNDLTSRVEELEGTQSDKKERIKELEEERKQTIAPHLAVSARVVATRAKLEELSAREDDQELDLDALEDELHAHMASFAAFDTSFRRFFFGDINWGVWVKPILSWAFIVLLAYVVLMSFNVLIFRQWAHNEKIIYPLAQLPNALAERSEGAESVIPPIFTKGLFWTGFAIAFCILGWNHLTSQRLITGIGEIPLDINLTQYFRHSFLEAIHRTRFTIFFTVIGLTFLVPSRISFSMWFFHLFFMLELIVLVWLGHGVDIRSFPQNSSIALNFRFAQGGGALIVFALVVLYKCRTYILCGLFPQKLETLNDEERAELRVSSMVFLVGSLTLVLAMTLLLGANLFYSLIFYLISLIVTIGLTRAVSEGGMLSYQCHFTPFHLIRSTFGMNKSWTDPALYAPLWVFHVLFFFDLKTFIAPMMAGGLKIRDTLRLQRVRFHAGVFGAILVAMVVGVATHIILGYDRGADSLCNWFYQGVPRSLAFGTLKTMTATHPTATSGMFWWVLFGAAIMVVILLARSHVFWMVHPIGIIMLVNPLMRGYWGSILIGWLFKSLVSKYGNKDTYERLRRFFIGLIVGEITACILGWAVLDRSWHA